MTPVPTKLVPLGNRVLLRKIEANVRGGLLVPQSSEIDEGTQEFEVVAVSTSSAASRRSPIEVDMWTLADELGVPNMGKPPAWAQTIVQRLAAQRMLGFDFGTAAGGSVTRIRTSDRIYLARHKGWKIETSSGDELYVAEVDDILALVVEASAVEETPLNGDQP